MVPFREEQETPPLSPRHVSTQWEGGRLPSWRRALTRTCQLTPSLQSCEEYTSVVKPPACGFRYSSRAKTSENISSGSALKCWKVLEAVSLPPLLSWAEEGTSPHPHFSEAHTQVNPEQKVSHLITCTLSPSAETHGALPLRFGVQ